LANIGDRFQAGQLCRQSGIYQFDGYIDDPTISQPPGEERIIPLANSEIFPSIKSENKACWWKLVRKV
jgi:hypothetical protein